MTFQATIGDDTDEAAATIYAAYQRDLRSRRQVTRVKVLRPPHILSTADCALSSSFAVKKEKTALAEGEASAAFFCLIGSPPASFFPWSITPSSVSSLVCLTCLGQVDFGDLCMVVVELFTNHPEVLERWVRII